MKRSTRTSICIELSIVKQALFSVISLKQADVMTKNKTNIKRRKKKHI